jgi:acyl-CoA thioester hydrolase
MAPSDGTTAAGGGPVVGEVTRRVPPRHCDAQEMMHASRPAEYFEDAFLAWLDAACGGYANLRAAETDLVIAETTTRYLAPARLGDEVTVRATPRERGRRSILIRFDLVRSDGEALVTATTTYVCVGPSGTTHVPPILENALAGVSAR